MFNRSNYVNFSLRTNSSRILEKSMSSLLWTDRKKKESRKMIHATWSSSSLVRFMVVVYNERRRGEGEGGALTSFNCRTLICSEKKLNFRSLWGIRGKNEDRRATGRSFPLLGEILHGKHGETFAEIVIPG